MSYAEWNPATTYVQNDIVAYLGSLYISLQTPNLNHNPSTATSFWALQGGGGVSKITAGTGITITPTGGIGNVTINATGGGGGTWQQVHTQASATYNTGQFNVTWNISPIPSNNAVPVILQISFSDLGNGAPPDADSYVSMGFGQITPTTVQWSPNGFLNPPPGPGSVYTYTYQFMIPPGNLGGATTVNGLWNFPAPCTCSSKGFIFA